MQFLKQSTGVTVLIGPILDSSGAAVTGAVIADLNITKNGSTAAMSGNTFTHSHNGHYLLTLTTTDTNTLGRLSISANNSAHAMPVFRYTVLVAAMFDAIVTNGNVSILDAAGVRSAVGLATANLDTQLSTIDDFLDTEIAAIKAKTDNLPTDPADASDIAASFATVNTKLDTIDDFLDTEIAAIKAKTDNLPTDPADQSAVEAAITAATSPLATAANLATVAGYLDTEIAAILADTNELQTDWANGGRLDVLLDTAVSDSTLARQILGNKHTVTESPAGTFTISVRNDADNATVRTIVYTPATGARTAS